MIKEPLSLRMRPNHIDEIIGQEHLLGEGKMLRRMVESNYISSMILFGPPGTGKTSTAFAIAKSLNLPVRSLNAVIHRKKDLEIVVEEAKMLGHLVLILDEVHRLDKARQDFLLPHLEENLFTLIGTTTSNPYHAINPAIRSRTHLFELKPLSQTEIELAIERALTDKKKGFGERNITLTEEAKRHFATSSKGDLRAVFNGLELAVISTPEKEDGEIYIDIQVAEQCMQKKSFSHDKDEDSHYDVLSAFQKSIRGSDVNAALHYLARLLEAGDLDSVGRRLVVIAYEDIGLANPQAGPRTLHAVEAAERLGLPEARIPLSVAVVELALSPKSNSAYKALDKAIADLRKKGMGEVPDHLRDAHYQGAEELGRGIGYKYPHDYPSGWVKQQYLPDHLVEARYYEPKDQGKFERALKQIYENIERQKR